MPEHTNGSTKAPTMADVAARAGVSRALVSTVFRNVPGASPTTRERVLKAAADLGYRVDNRARTLRSNRTGLVGVVFRVQDAFHSDFVEALYPVADKSRFNLVLSATTRARSEVDAAEALFDDRCEALILVAPQMPDTQLIDLAQRSPTIVVGRKIRSTAVDVVRTPDEEVVRLAVDHLVSQGHRRIAHLDGRSIRGSVDRRRSYLKAMRGLGLEEHATVIAGGNTEIEGMRAAETILAAPVRPTAILAFNDTLAVGLMFGLRQSGVAVPEEISVIGYDDIHMSALPFINLTTVGQDATATARGVLDQVAGRLDDKSPAGSERLVPPYLKVRTTTARPTS
ncbi:LacI family DNA-binding transcriptional regulator [Gordonia insulae]|uniref:HTH-type transcriptional regulator AscG n=1 Tax=Gordonia insulae TaxID=2420509 RepID=A0A3G8JRI8_9ACTN|nr:LacI family DNA-binding transcriptional regulator [Gordonia insulae]AZG47543.1 HTH-type transcriptional regulator AscG [Gordonia insulae]